MRLDKLHAVQDSFPDGWDHGCDRTRVLTSSLVVDVAQGRAGWPVRSERWLNASLAGRWSEICSFSLS